MSPLYISLIIFALTVISFMAGYFSMATTALISMILLVFTGCIDAKTALSGFSNSNTIIMASMFVISAGFSRTQMVSKLSSMVAKISKGSFVKVLAGYVLITALLTQFVQSAMAVFSIVFPLACAMCDDMKISRSKMMFSIGITSIATVSILPIGGNAVAYITNNGYLEAFKYTTFKFQMLDPMIARLPSLIFIVLYAIFIAPKFAPEQMIVDAKEVEAKFSTGDGKLGSAREIIGYVVFFGVILALITQQFHKIENWQITFLGALIMVASGILKPKDAYNAISLGGMVMLYVGVLALGNALTATGAGTLVGNAITTMIGGTTNGYVIGFVFFVVPFLLTQVMMNVAVMNIFTPIAILTCKTLGCNPIGPMMLVTIGSLTAFMTPLATPSVPMIMGLGGYDQKTMLKMSWLPALIMCALNVIWVMTVFPAF